MKKKLWLVLCLIACVFAMTACSSSESSTGKASFSYDANSLKETTKQYLSSWNETDFSSYLMDPNQQLPADTKAMFTDWAELKGQIGTFDSVTSTSINESTDAVTVALKVKYSDASINFSVSFDQTATATVIKAEKVLTLMEQAEIIGLKVVMVMGVIFIALLIFFGIIYAVKLMQNAFSGSAKQDNTKAVDSIIASIAQQENELVGDQELVAVITAAIMASMGSSAPAEGLVVRSIKRKSTNNWNKA